LVGTLTPDVVAALAYSRHGLLYVRSLLTNEPPPPPPPGSFYVTVTVPLAYRVITATIITALTGALFVMIDLSEREAKKRDDALGERVKALEDAIGPKN
jgi:hypothetical protein